MFLKTNEGYFIPICPKITCNSLVIRLIIQELTKNMLYFGGFPKLTNNYAKIAGKINAIDDYAKDGGPGEVQLLCSVYYEPLST